MAVLLIIDEVKSNCLHFLLTNKIGSHKKYNHGEACRLGLAPRIALSCLISPSRHMVRVIVSPTSVDASK